MPVTTTTAAKSGFWIAMADASGAKTAVETRLHPGPTRVEYPNTSLGDVVETADGRVVVQVSNRDPRRRSWIWTNFGPDVVIYERQQRWLQQLTARVRMGLGLPSQVYVYDGATGLLNVDRNFTTTVSGVTGNTLTIPSLPGSVVPANLKHAVVEVLPATGGSSFPYERRSVLLATSTTLLLDDPLSGSLGASGVLLTWSEPAWWKARVLDTTRELRGEGGSVRYSTSKLVFVIDEEITL